MIAKIPEKRKDGKSSFRDLVDYASKGKGEEKVEYVNFQNLLSIETAVFEMEALASENKRCKDPVFHLVLSFRETEIPTKEQIDEAVQIALDEHGLKDCQAVWGLHRNTENRHIHIAVNRIDPETAKAIQPAENWTFKANERLSRRIELAQGWEIEQSGRHYTVTSDGQVVPKSIEKNSPPALSPKAKDSEAHTAFKSAESIGQEVAAQIIREAKTWEELHRNLANQGIAFEKKGSGAVFKIGDTFIKASVAGRDISLSKLESKLGGYEPRNQDVSIVPRQTEPIKKVNPKIFGTWEEYQSHRTEYYSSKNKSFDELRKNQKEEIAALSKKQKDARGKTFDCNWKGKGRELNQLRSITAARQKIEKLNLRDKHREELKEFKNCFPKAFPNFKTWLQQKDDSLAVAFRYRGMPVMLSPEEQEKKTTYADLRAFTAIAGSKSGVAYTRNNMRSADFLDYGSKILISDKYDPTSILAALQLAAQKWGSVNLSGSDEYKRLCVDMAAKHNIKITNPELQEMIQAADTKYGKGKTEKAISLFNNYANAVGAEKFRIVVTEFKNEGGIQAFVMDKAKDGKTREEVVNAIPRLEAYAKYNKNVNVVPLSEDKHHILVDDVSPENLQKISQDGYKPACVIESSPQNYQVIVTVQSLGDDREAANKLTKELNTRYGDPKLSGAVHAHRLPPFQNFKEKHKREDGTFPETKLIETPGSMCDKAFSELKTINNQLKEYEEKKVQEQNILKDKVFTSSWSYGAGASDPTGAYWAHYRDIAAKHKGDLDYSRIDAMIGVRMRVTGYNLEQVQNTIEENAPAMRKENMTEAEYNGKYRNRNWHRYAKETAEKFVFGPRGTIQYGRAEEYRPLYMKLEGRSMSQEFKQFQEIEAERDRNLVQEQEGEEI